jgi:sulfur relay (sulfurtransferase) complex TusBCD TusD component (DsrE family)
VTEVLSGVLLGVVGVYLACSPCAAARGVATTTTTTTTTTTIHDLPHA